MTMHDFTSELSSKTIVWTGPQRTVDAQFPEPMRRIDDGLYLFLYRNPSYRTVRDNNTTPKPVIRAGGASVKPGKFENGLIARARNHRDHLRRDEVDGDVTLVFSDSLALALVLDLTPLSIGLDSPARVFERFWTESIDLFLRKRGLLASDQNMRAEWRFLDKGSVTPSLHEDLRQLTERLSVKIENMAAALT